MTAPVDFYETLGVARVADGPTIKKAFRKIALRYHPDKDGSPEAKVTYGNACMAYDVLSHPERKGIYDLYGMRGLEKGVYQKDGSITGGNYAFDPETDCVAVFETFFGTDNPYQALNDMAAAFEGLTTIPTAKEGKTKILPISVTFEEVYHGCLKKVKHLQKIVGENDIIDTREFELAIDVKPGSPNGTRYVFDGLGNALEGQIPGKAVYTLQVIPHDHFQRDGADLLYLSNLPLVDALAGCILRVPHLDGRVLDVPVLDVAAHASRIRVPNEGFVMPGDAGGKGDLVVIFQPLFPNYLSQEQKGLMRAAFLLPRTLTAEQERAVRAFKLAFQHETKGWARVPDKAM